MPAIEEVLTALTPKWFDRASVYTGSEGEFRYRFRREKEAVSAAVYTHLCYEKAGDVEEREFPRDEQGVELLRRWVAERYQLYVSSNEGQAADVDAKVVRHPA
ncbi:hypothetical protein KQI82_01735 [Oscillibacter sp. MSJ-2]|uniref:Large polyvalent protein associated domain-containing protein n=1 Tax=Dysosmobacter acutus TaxID=2841504 RepID=A0ABS6F6I7_9FIRM|nr:hypothetical protein [Dysosmobacter acutus]MBU5625655.1 hypothetical protein [Dysosmobacter acutus]